MDPLPLRPISQSSDLEAVGYDPDLEILDVKFKKSNKISRYFNVGQLVFDGLMAAQSKGAYFSANIRHHYMSLDISASK